MARTGKAVADELHRKINAGYSFPVWTCLKQIRLLFDVPAYDFTPSNGRDPWAIEAFDFAKFKHRTTDLASAPDFVPIFWRGNPGRPGHIALKLPNGMCGTTDLPEGGKFGIVSIAEINRRWGMTPVGWTEDLNKVRVWTPPKAVPPAVQLRPLLRKELLEARAVTQSPLADKVTAPVNQKLIAEAREHITLALRAANKLPQ